MANKKGNPINTGSQSADGRFKAGNTMGPGRVQGSRNNATIAMQEMLSGESGALTRKAIDMALGGDTTALRICIDRLVPPCKDRPIHLKVPPMTNTGDAVSIMEKITTSVMEGEITPSEAMSVAGVVEVYRKTIETQQVVNKCIEIEERMRLAGI
jgi:hypothetical protein